MSFSVILLKNPLRLRLGRGPFCHQSLTRGYHVLLQQGEMHLTVYALALCVYAAAPHCHKQRCPPILANTTIPVHFDTVLLRYLGWRFILDKHALMLPGGPLIGCPKVLVVCHTHNVP